MKRLDLVKLRKTVGISQRELAEKLAVRPSFLSAVENGRSRFPEDKTDRLREIIKDIRLEDFIFEDNIESGGAVPPHTHPHTHTHFDHEGLMERIDFLEKRNDRLSEKVDNLRDEADNLRKENLRLKELLSRNHIEY